MSGAQHDAGPRPFLFLEEKEKGKWAADRVGAGAAPQQAATDAIAYLFKRLGGHGGLILMDRAGRVGIAHNTPGMAWGYATKDGIRAGLAAPTGF